MTTRGTGGTMSPLIPSIAWSWRWSRGAIDRERRGDRRHGQGPHRDDSPRLMTSDEYPAYASAIEAAFGVPVTRPATGPGRRPILPERRLPEDLTYATVHKEREKDRVVAVERRRVFGTGAAPGSGPGGVGGEPDGQHVVRRAPARHRPRPERAESAEDVPVQQGLACARGDDLLHAVPLQLLLGGPHSTATR